MNILFVHDHKFRKINGDIYSTGGLSDEVLSRYTSYAASLTVIARIIEETSSADRWTKITDPKVSILGSSGLKFAELKNEIIKCDKLIVRLPSFLGLQALKINQKIGKPYLIEMVACAWDALWFHGIKGKITAPCIFLANKYYINKAPYTLYVTKEFLQKRYPTKGINIGISDVVLPEKTGEDIPEKRKTHITENTGRIVLGTAAAVNVKYKGQAYVIKALSLLKEKGYTNYVYQLVGSGDQERLKKYAEKCGVSDQVEFLGSIPHNEMFGWLDSIDLYLQPSFQEGLSRAIVEAMSRALPCIVSDAGGNPELIDPAFVCGRKGNFAAKLAESISSMDKQTMLVCAERNYTFARNFDSEKLNSERIRFMKQFLENK